MLLQYLVVPETVDIQYRGHLTGLKLLLLHDARLPRRALAGMYVVPVVRVSSFIDEPGVAGGNAGRHRMP